MTSTEIKTRLHSIIEDINDEDLLQAIYDWLSKKQDSVYSPAGYKLTEEEFVANVREGEEDIRQGKTLSHEEVISRLKSRLSAK